MRTKILHRIEPIEADILKTICDYLDRNRLLYIRHNPISPVRDKGHITWRKVRPSQLGAPDLLVFWGRRLPQGIVCQPIAIEVKTGKGIMSPGQKKWQARAGQAGLTYCLVRSFEDFAECLGRYR